MGVVVSILIACVFLSLIGKWRNLPSRKGKRGEMIVSSILSNLPPDYHLLDNVVLRTKGGTSQIDHVVVSRYGIFAIETKNYRGEIYGDDNRQQWTQIIVTNVTYLKKWYKTYSYVTKNRFYNPVKQSLTHIYALKDSLQGFPNVKIVPIVVFIGEAVLKEVHSNTHVIYGDDLLRVILSYTTPSLSDEDVEIIYNHLVQQDAKEVVSNKEHVQNIRITQSVRNNKIRSGICPRCGGELVERKGRYSSFYGCSNYPNCKFTLEK